ncbi:hypothetical protein LPE01_11880 [Lactiplantibacillus pentosus]|nr:hypothetical protein LPE01_11880 [Lactiplantibacillus pentosus]
MLTLCLLVKNVKSFIKSRTSLNWLVRVFFCAYFYFNEVTTYKFETIEEARKARLDAERRLLPQKR